MNVVIACRCHPRGMELLWQPEITRVYMPLLSNSANVVTVEAALGSLQNLTACTWQVPLDTLVVFVLVLFTSRSDIKI